MRSYVWITTICGNPSVSAADLRGRIEAVAEALVGEPNSRIEDNKRGAWYDHEAEVGGVLDLIVYNRGRPQGLSVENRKRILAVPLHHRLPPIHTVAD